MAAAATNPQESARTLCTLPGDIIAHIASFLPTKDLVALMGTGRAVRHVLHEHLLAPHQLGSARDENRDEAYWPRDPHASIRVRLGRVCPCCSCDNTTHFMPCIKCFDHHQRTRDGERTLRDDRNLYGLAKHVKAWSDVRAALERLASDNCDLYNYGPQDVASVLFNGVNILLSQDPLARNARAPGVYVYYENVFSAHQYLLGIGELVWHSKPRKKDESVPCCVVTCGALSARQLYACGHALCMRHADASHKQVASTRHTCPLCNALRPALDVMTRAVRKALERNRELRAHVAETYGLAHYAHVRVVSPIALVDARTGTPLAKSMAHVNASKRARVCAKKRKRDDCESGDDGDGGGAAKRQPAAL